nr:hypothetical protein [Tanacetum cinerariifolium]GFB39112.1 hypothetical protein [Tanacetum cinerariifolium]
MVQMQISLTKMNTNKLLMSVQSELGIHDHNNEPCSSKLVPKVTPPADKTATSRQALDLLFHHHITMLSSELEIYDYSNEPTSSKLVPKVVPPADKTATSQQELELLFSHMYKECFNTGNLSVSKSSALSDNLQ